MRLTAPTRLTFLMSVALAVIAVVARVLHYMEIPFPSAGFALLLAGYLVLLAGVLFEKV